MAKKITKATTLVATSIRYLLSLMVIIIALSVGYVTYQAQQQSDSKSNVHGTWIEIGSPPYKTDTLTLSDNGVLMNHRLISTSFDFDGKLITINTGSGTTVYTISGSADSPRLKRLIPSVPAQQFVKEGYEHTAAGDNHGVMQQRRASLTEHFQK
ncbi:DUF2850 domain-containing protein [Vibrio artabrorum]|uniref:DUF2850 domain-containing protein n=1 Tax=Vibrio artabrorum TaxID=446374 RepID=A0ABT8CLR7_9VIBR|nr:DUF2850 domain-containing protein [Vibrio artabrorum]MDN3702653.1 DUF2850 domain-containing protein [Vibrio artabrorum]